MWSEAMIIENIYDPESSNSCFFRTTVKSPYKKMLLQVTEKCNLNCKHCFVSSTDVGREISYSDIEKYILPSMLDAKVSKVTLTGGEPLLHKDILKIINLLSNNNIIVSVCTNASLITREFMDKINEISNIHFNVSLDGFSSTSHGTFRGIDDDTLYYKIISNIQVLGEMNLLNGILVTPNKYSSIDEYKALCEFAIENHAHYVLMNPLSNFGRGEESHSLALSKQEMIKLREDTQIYSSEKMQMVYIRFPNDDKPLSTCEVGKIMYIFCNGDVAVCPYMVFAAKTASSHYDPRDFILTNVIKEPKSINEKLLKYDLSKLNSSGRNHKCSLDQCNRGCNAAKIANGKYLYECDLELCPIL